MAKLTRQVKAGNVLIGGGAAVSVQSMTNTDTADVEATLSQIRALAISGADIVRVSVYNEACAKAVRALVDGSGSEFELKEDPLLFKYCGTIQEEVHRFAIEYHRSLHNKNSIGSVLDNIRGIGPAKRNALLAHFNSIEDIKKAEIEQLMEVQGITENNALAIKEYFR